MSNHPYQQQLQYSKKYVQKQSPAQTQIPQQQESHNRYPSPTRKYKQSQSFNNSTTLGQSTGFRQSSPSSNLHDLKLIEQSSPDHQINISNSNGLHFSKILGDINQSEQVIDSTTETYVFRSSQPIDTSKIVQNRNPQVKRIQSMDRPNYAFQSTSENPIYVEKIIKIDNSNTLETNQLKQNNKLLQEENSKLIEELTQLRNQVPESIEQIVFIEDLTEVRRLEQQLKNLRETNEQSLQDSVTQQTNQLNIQITELRKQILINHSKLHELIEQIELLTVAVENRNKHIKQLEDIVHSQKQEIQQLREIVQERDSQIFQLQHIIKTQDTRVEQYRRDLSILTDRYDSLVQEKEVIKNEKRDLKGGLEYQIQTLQTRNEELSRQIIILQNLLKEAESNNQRHHDHHNNNNSLLIKVLEEKIEFWSQRIKQQQLLIEEQKRTIAKLERELRSQQTYCREHHHHNLPEDVNEILKIETDSGTPPIILENNPNTNNNDNKHHNHHELHYSKLLVKISPIEIQISQEPPAPLNSEPINSPAPHHSFEQLKFRVGECKFQPSTYISCDKDNHKPTHNNLQEEPNGVSYLHQHQDKLKEELEGEKPQEDNNVEQQLYTVQRLTNELQQMDSQNLELQQEVVSLLGQLKEKERDNNEQNN